MKYDTFLFDLDGTISDPIVGIARSLNFALTSFGFNEISESEVSKFIGPQIDETFRLLANTDSTDLVTKLVNKYRERYSAIGYSENTLYPDISEVLEFINKSGIPMGICTSKREDFAKKIISMLKLDNYFSFINGGDVGIHKKTQIASLIREGKVTNQSIMIGDRSFDIVSGKENGLSTAGVLWGYGSKTELLNENPDHIIESPLDIIKLIS